MSAESEVSLYAAVLAGGLSSRMGCDKRFLEIDGEPLVARALRLARAAIGGPDDRVFLCGNVPGYVSFPDQVAGLGPIGGLVSAMQQVSVAASGQESWLLVMPVDMPLLTASVLGRLVSGIPDAATGGAIGYVGYELPFVLRCNEQARAVLTSVCRETEASRRSVRTLLERLDTRRLPEVGGSEMLNTNSPRDWANLGKAVSR